MNEISEDLLQLITNKKVEIYFYTETIPGFRRELNLSNIKDFITMSEIEFLRTQLELSEEEMQKYMDFLKWCFPKGLHIRDEDRGRCIATTKKNTRCKNVGIGFEKMLWEYYSADQIIENYDSIFYCKCHQSKEQRYKLYRSS